MTATCGNCKYSFQESVWVPEKKEHMTTGTFDCEIPIFSQTTIELDRHRDIKPGRYACKSWVSKNAPLYKEIKVHD